MNEFNFLRANVRLAAYSFCIHHLLARCLVCSLQEWWTYVCLGPGDPHPNWHLGMRGTQHRAVMWRVWKEGGTGFLYWGANCYEKATVPSAEVSASLCVTRN